MDLKHGTTFVNCYLFFEGILGTLILIVETLFGHGLHVISTGSMLMLVLCASLFFLNFVLLGYSVRIGLAGVAISIWNMNIPFHTALSSFALHQ